MIENEKWKFIKFSFFGKAIKNLRNPPHRFDVKVHSENVVAFSEYMNFKCQNHEELRKIAKHFVAFS